MTERDCKHGQLARSCECCELENEVAALRAALTEAERERDQERRTIAEAQRCRCAQVSEQGVPEPELRYAAKTCALHGRVTIQGLAWRRAVAAEARATELVKALARWGDHLPECAARDAGHSLCSCGWVVFARAVLVGSQPEADRGAVLEAALRAARPYVVVESTPIDRDVVARDLAKVDAALNLYPPLINPHATREDDDA